MLPIERSIGYTPSSIAWGIVEKTLVKPRVSGCANLGQMAGFIGVFACCRKYSQSGIVNPTTATPNTRDALPMASITTNSKKQIVLQWYYRSEKFQVAFRDPVEAEQLKAQVETEIAKYKATGKESVFLNSYLEKKKHKEKNVNTNPSKQTINKLLDLHYQEKKLNWDESTICTHKSIFESLKELMKEEKYIQNVDKQAIIKYATEIQKGIASVTARGRYVILLTFIKWCYENEYIDSLPWGKGSPPKIKKEQSVRKNFLLLEEVNILLQTARKVNFNSLLYCAIGIYSGLRNGEIQRLKWCDIYNAEKVLGFEGRRIQDVYNLLPPSSKDIEGDIKKLKGNEKAIADYFLSMLNKTPKQMSDYNSKITVYKAKNKKIRDVPLIANLCEILREGYQKRFNELLKLGIEPNDVTNTLLQEYIVRPKKTHYSNVNYRFKGALIVQGVMSKGIEFKRNGIPFKVTPHILRYTFASLLLNAGEAPDNVRRYLGHSHQTMTDHYTFLMVETKRISF